MSAQDGLALRGVVQLEPSVAEKSDKEIEKVLDLELAGLKADLLWSLPKWRVSVVAAEMASLVAAAKGER